MAGESRLGIMGLAVMGQNLARNVAHHAIPVAVYNRTTERTEEFYDAHRQEGPIIATRTIEEFVQAIVPPRPILLMVKAGRPVDQVIEQLAPYLDPNDILIDGGNSFFADTQRRAREVHAAGLRFIGTGISGGEEGALHGPSIMPGGSEAAYREVEPMLTRIAAQVDGTPCCTYIGTDGAGHYVKMVHNGIEYADMQLIVEAYDLLRQALGLGAAELADIFAEWNQDRLDSYLVEITAAVLRKTDAAAGQPLVDVILDEAAQKGTGKWTSQSALDLGVPATTITEAVFARFLSALKNEREAAAQVLPGPAKHVGTKGQPADLVNAVRDALYASKVVAYAQGLQQLTAAAEEYRWQLDIGRIATIWRGGCIIRAAFLDRIKEAYEADPQLPNLLLAPYFRDAVVQAQESWRSVVGLAVELGVPAPAFSSALAYYDGYRRARGPGNLIQGLRDYFGAHTYRRVDRPGSFHTRWAQDGAEETAE